MTANNKGPFQFKSGTVFVDPPETITQIRSKGKNVQS
jgi:hypothetical protein